MSLTTTVAGSIATSSIQWLPLQFSGEFLELAIAFLVLALVAGLLGARGVAGLSMEIARLLVLLFIVLAVISLVL